MGGCHRVKSAGCIFTLTSGAYMLVCLRYKRREGFKLSFLLYSHKCFHVDEILGENVSAYKLAPLDACETVTLKMFHVKHFSLTVSST